MAEVPDRQVEPEQLAVEVSKKPVLNLPEEDYMDDTPVVSKASRVNELRAEKRRKEFYLSLLYIIVVLAVVYASNDEFPYRFFETLYQLTGKSFKQRLERFFINNVFSGASADLFARCINRSPECESQVKTIENYWQWMNEKLVPLLLSGNKKSPCFIPLFKALILGSVRLRQHRIINDKVVCKRIKNLSICLKHGDFYGDDERMYKPNWVPMLEFEMNATTGSQSHGTESWWLFDAQPHSHGLTSQGRLDTYDAKGYIVNTPSHVLLKEVLQSVQNSSWIDSNTKVLFIEFNLHNVDSGIFGMVELMLEFLPIGTVYPSYTYRVFKVHDPGTSSYNIMMAALALYVLLIAYFVFQELCLIYKSKLKYFTSASRWLQLLTCVFSLASVAMYYFKIDVSSTTMKMAHNDTGSFTMFWKVASVDYHLSQLMGVLVFMASLKFFGLLKANRQMALVGKVVFSCAEKLKSYSFILFVVLVSYSLTFQMIFGSKLSDFKSFSRSLGSLFAMLLGNATFNDLKKVDETMAITLYFSFMIITSILLLDILAAIVGERYEVIMGSTICTHETFGPLTRRFIAVCNKFKIKIANTKWRPQAAFGK
uniref:polycystin-2-like protein 1 n=1 Tax=Myxine glutinosa TaxID=7769 RepID=UPI00358E80CE